MQRAMMLNKARRIPAQGGFTLLEMTIALSILGMMVAGGVYILSLSERAKQIDQTHERMNRVLAALSGYVESNGRLPCPADPGRADELFGWEWGVTQASISSGRPIPDQNPGNRLDNPTCESWGVPPAAGGVPRNMGIVPFLTLGLSPSDVRDGWGRYLTYAVSPVFAQNNDNVRDDVGRENGSGQVNPAAADQGSVHIRCLDGAWYDNKDNVNGVKAKFCCARDGNTADFATNTDIQIMAVDGTAIWPVAGGEPYRAVRDTANARYAFVSPGIPGGIDAPYQTNDRNIIAPAVVLVSHGKRGDGAFLANNTRARHGAGSAVIAAEADNGAQTNAASWDRNFRIGPLSEGAANYFDDIVVWRTQAGIIAENGTSSCRYP